MVRISEVHSTRLSTVKHSGPTEMSAIACVSAFQRCPEWEVPLYKNLCYTALDGHETNDDKITG